MTSTSCKFIVLGGNNAITPDKHPSAISSVFLLESLFLPCFRVFGSSSVRYSPNMRTKSSNFNCRVCIPEPRLYGSSGEGYAGRALPCLLVPQLAPCQPMPCTAQQCSQTMPSQKILALPFLFLPDCRQATSKQITKMVRRLWQGRTKQSERRGGGSPEPG
jgi:hypothetical protein